jgi:Flp pilus assembly protein TadG
VALGNTEVESSDVPSARTFYARMTSSNTRHPVKSLRLRVTSVSPAINLDNTLVFGARFASVTTTYEGRASSMRRIRPCPVPSATMTRALQRISACPVSFLGMMNVDGASWVTY